MSNNFLKSLLIMSPLGIAIGIMLASVVTYASPKQFESNAVVELKPLGWNMPAGSAEDEEFPLWMKAEIENIRNNESLDQVISRLKLENRWNIKTEKARDVLNRGLTVQPIRGTDLVSIRMRHFNKEDARDIALELTNILKKRRQEIFITETERRHLALSDSLRIQEEKVNAMDQAGRNSEIESEQKLLEAMKLKLMVDTIAAKIPFEPTVIHEMPSVSDRPASPNVTLNLVLGGVIGFFISPLFAVWKTPSVNSQRVS